MDGTYVNPTSVGSGNAANVSFSGIIDMSANDTAVFYVNVGNSAKTIGVLGAASPLYTWVSGYLIC
jgi:C4-dicarboxylate transporter